MEGEESKLVLGLLFIIMALLVPIMIASILFIMFLVDVNNLLDGLESFSNLNAG